MAKILIALTGLRGHSVLHSWALSLLWLWFIVPVFSVPTITVDVSQGGTRGEITCS
jgi:hypothetical protein